MSPALLTVIFEVANDIGAAEILAKSWKLVDSCEEVQVLTKLVNEIDCYTVVEQSVDEIVLATCFVTGEVLVKESDCVKEVVWGLWQTTRVFNLAGEVAMRHNLELGYVEVLCDLVCLGML
jgi:hypothetical protein